MFEVGGRHLATVLESLGTKSTIARDCQEQTGLNRFDAIGYDTVATIVNDLVCVGAMPISVNAYFATGSPKWYEGDGRLDALAMGWARGCEDAGATWGGGETPALPGIVADGEIDLAGSALGALPDGTAPILGENLAPSDEIVLVANTGLHTGGANFVPKIAADLGDGYATKLESGETFAKAALRETEIYVSLIETLLREKMPVTYMNHITDSGLLNLMHSPKSLTYRIDDLPPVPEVLSFIIDHFEIGADEAYSTFNMGVGFAVFCKPGASDDVVLLANILGFDARLAGHVEAGPRQVILEQSGIVYEGGKRPTG